MDRRVIIGLGIGCAVLCVLLLIASGVGVWLLAQAAERPADIVVEVNAPANATVGDEFIIEVTIQNTGQQSRELNSIDIFTSYLEGIIIERTTPAYNEFQGNILGGFHSYYFLIPLPAESSTTVQIFARAGLSGNFSGNMDVCIDTAFSCISTFIHTIVQE